MSLLHEFASNGDAGTLIELLSETGLDINDTDLDYGGKTPLHWACVKGHTGCTKVLIRHKASLSCLTHDEKTPAHLAAEKGNIGCLRALIEAGAPFTWPDIYNDTPKRLAEIYGHKDCIKLIIEAEQSAKLGSSEKIQTKSKPPLVRSSRTILNLDKLKAALLKAEEEENSDNSCHKTDDEDKTEAACEENFQL